MFGVLLIPLFLYFPMAFDVEDQLTWEVDRLMLVSGSLPVSHFL